MNPRSALMNERVNARVGSLADGADQASTTFSTIVWIVGLGFIAYFVLQHIAPALIGGATKTKHAYRNFKGSRDEAPHAEAHEPSPRYLGHLQHDAEFTIH